MMHGSIFRIVGEGRLMAERSGREDSVGDAKASRLTTIDRSAELLPWRRARELTRCFLYWIPVSTFPIPTVQRGWLMEFLTRWTLLMKERGFRPETFLQYKTVHPDLMKPLLSNMMELIPVMGLGRKPGTALPEFPSEAEVQQSTKAMFDALSQKKSVDLPDAKKYMPDYAYWFVEKSDKEQRELFLGYGGLSMAFLKPDPNTAAPPLPFTPILRKKLPMLEQLERNFAKANSLRDSFLAKSKEFFGGGLEQEPQMKGIPFILPLLDSADFFSQPAEVIEKCFQLFDAYIRESPSDKGVLLAVKQDIDIEDGLIELLNTMREEKLVYIEA
jgi:hypothetical protein